MIIKANFLNHLRVYEINIPMHIWIIITISSEKLRKLTSVEESP